MNEEIKCPLCAKNLKRFCGSYSCGNKRCEMFENICDKDTFALIGKLARNANLGRAVQAMPVGMSLTHDDSDGWQVDIYPSTTAYEKTPEEALEKAGVRV